MSQVPSSDRNSPARLLSLGKRGVHCHRHTVEPKIDHDTMQSGGAIVASEDEERMDAMFVIVCFLVKRATSSIAAADSSEFQNGLFDANDPGNHIS